MFSVLVKELVIGAVLAELLAVGATPVVKKES